MTTRRNLPPDTEPPSTSSSNRDERRRREDGEVATAEAATSAMTELKIQDFDWMDEDDFDGTGMWVFGYGSLCWHQGFTYNKSLTGCIRGFSRKFWQGNTTHRGTEKKVNSYLSQWNVNHQREHTNYLRYCQQITATYAINLIFFNFNKQIMYRLKN